MQFEEYLAKVTKALELGDDLCGDEDLNDLEDWDSLKILSFIAFADKEFSLQPKLSQLEKCQSLRQLYALLIND